MSPSPGQADTPWSKLWPDVAWLVAGVCVMGVSYAVDYRAACADWFERSGSLAVLFSGIVAYRSLTKHYRKFFNVEERGRVLTTSANQLRVDRATIVLSVVGTLVWGYGAKILEFVSGRPTTGCS